MPRVMILENPSNEMLGKQTRVGDVVSYNGHLYLVAYCPIVANRRQFIRLNDGQQKVLHDFTVRLLPKGTSIKLVI